MNLVRIDSGEEAAQNKILGIKKPETNYDLNPERQLSFYEALKQKLSDKKNVFFNFKEEASSQIQPNQQRSSQGLFYRDLESFGAR